MFFENLVTSRTRQRILYERDNHVSMTIEESIEEGDHEEDEEDEEGRVEWMEEREERD